MEVPPPFANLQASRGAERRWVGGGKDEGGGRDQGGALDTPYGSDGGVQDGGFGGHQLEGGGK